MIIEFSLGNFRSFKEVETISMAASSIRSKDKELDTANIFKVSEKLSLLRSKAIYGANGSGKSNVIKGFVAFKRLLRFSITKQDSIEETCDDFLLSGESQQKPVFYQLIFLDKEITYRYGFEVMKNEVVTEWLFRQSGVREVKLFTRERMTVSVNAAQFSEAKKFENLTASGDSDIFQPHSLFLTATAAVGVRLAKSIQQIISSMDVVSSTDTGTLRDYSVRWWLAADNRQKGVGLLRAANTGVEDMGLMEEEIETEKLPPEIQVLLSKGVVKKIPRLTSIRTFRSSEDSNKINVLETLFDSFESEGTQKLSHFIPLLIDALEHGKPLWIDEFDSSLHPLLTKKIVSLFHSADTNPHGAQLIFATHDTNLLKSSFLRRDQICFVEKDNLGASHLRTLVEFKGVRNDASYDKDYLQGRYGAIPFLNELDEAVQNGIGNHE